MARYDVYRNPSSTHGLLLDVQSNLLDDLQTRMVVPLLPAGAAYKPIRHLNPALSVGGGDFVLATQMMAAVPASLLQEPVANLTAHHDAILRAIDILFNRHLGSYREARP